MTKWSTPLRITRGRRLGTALAAAVAVALAGLGTIPASASVASAAAVDDGPTNGLLAWYKLDETAGTAVADSSGNGLNATVTGTSSWNGGQGFNFAGGASGSGNYIKLPNNLLTGLNAVSVSFDVLIDPAMSGNYFLFNLGNTSTTGYLFVTGQDGSGRYRGGFTLGTNTGEQNAQRAGGLTKNTWKRVTYVVQGGATGAPGATYLYDDGVLAATNTTITFAPSGLATTTNNMIGRSPWSGDRSFQGKIKDFRIYNRVLTGTEVATLATPVVTAGLASDKTALTLGDTSAVTANLTLPATGASGSTVTWSSSNTGVVSDTGAVTRPIDGPVDLTLTATITRSGQSVTKAFDVHVLKVLSDQEKATADAAAVVVPNIGDVRGSLSLPTKGSEGSTLTWVSSNAAVITATGEVVRPAHGQPTATVTLTGTATYGTATATRVLTATVPALPVTAEKTAYFFPHFTGETADGEKIYFASSKGNDALHWNNLNNGLPVLTSAYGEKGLRDPFIIRSPEGDKFYLLATDLKVYPGTDFARAQQSGSTYLEIWESTDLVNWSDQRHVKVSSDFAGNTWAPEAYYDDASQSYVVYWASNIYPTTTVAGRSYTSVYNKMMYATTRDFVTFSEAKPWIDVKRGTGLGMIDSTVIKDGNTFYRFTKDEAYMAPRQEKSTNLLATVSGSLPTTTSTPGWQLITEKVAAGLANAWGGTYNQGEGPTIFKANPGDVTVSGNADTWYLFIDQPSYHGGKGYTPFKTTDLNSGVWTSSGAASALPSSPRHGTVLPITQAEYDAVLKKYQPNLFVAGVEAATVSTVEGVAPVLPAESTVTYGDGSTAQVAVTWDTIAPSAYAQPGTFTVQGTVVAGASVRASAVVTVTRATVDSQTAVSVEKSSISTKENLVITATVTAPVDFSGTVQLFAGANKIADNPLYKGTPSGQNPIYQGTAIFRVPGSGLPTGKRQYTVKFVSDASSVTGSVSGPFDVEVYFFDKAPGSSFYTEIAWLASAGITTGNADGGFDPAGLVSRQAMAAFLYRYEHPGAVAPVCTSAPFADVAVGADFCGEIAWLKSTGITSGFEGNTFRPGAQIDRQAMAAFLFRLVHPGAAKPLCTSAPFADVAVGSQFCGEIAWLKSTQITTGYAGNKFQPGEKISRQAMAAFLYRLHNL